MNGVTGLNADSVLGHAPSQSVADFRLLGLVLVQPRKQDLFDVGESGTSFTVPPMTGGRCLLVVGKMTSLPSRSYVRPSTSDMVYLAKG